jgi:uncharacterized membrane protein HdeD (DUF308 family)
VAAYAGVEVPRWASILFGVISIIAGVLALSWPGITILVLVSLLGLQVLLYGLLAVVEAFRTGEGRILAVLFGVISLLAGAALFLRPLRNLGAVLAVLAIFWLVGGIIQVIGSLVERGEGWGMDLLTGLVTLVSGIVVIAWPGITLLAIALTAGVWMIIIGLIRIGFVFRSNSDAVAA